MTERLTHSPRPLPGYYDQATVLLLEQNRQLDRMERKLDQIPKNGNDRRSGGIRIAGAWFKDAKSLIMWFLIAAFIAGHYTAEDLRGILLMH